MLHRTVWGVDIGNSAIKAIKMIRSGAESRIIDFDIIDIQQSDDEASRPQRVQAALSTLCANHSFGWDAVYLSLPGELCLFREFQLPPGSESKLNDLVLYEAKQQIPFPLDQVYMGWERYDDPSGAGLGVEMIVVRKNIVQDFLAMTDQFKLNIQGVTVAPVAIYNFIKYEYQPQGAVLVLDAGYKSTDFVVMNGRHMYSRPIQIAGREITRVLENKFKVGYDRAEELKKNIGQSKQADKILSVIDPTMRQLSAEIQRTIGFYKSKARGQKISHGYLLGHTFRLPKMADTMASQVREAPFTLVENVQRIVLDRAVNPGVFGNEFPTMAVAIGLGLQGLGISELSVNLLPPERVQKNRLERVRAPAALAAAALLAAVGVSYFTSTKALEQQTALKTIIENALKDSERFNKGIDALTAPLLPQKQRVEVLARAVRDRGRLLEIYNKIVGLKGVGDEPMFGPKKDAKNSLYLTNLYISRLPFSATDGALQPVGPQTAASDRNKRVTDSIYLKKGAVGLYHSLAQAEGKPVDVPLIVVLSCECSDMAMQRPLFNALKEIIEIGADMEKSPPQTSVEMSRSEELPSLNRFGMPTDKPVHASVETKYKTFDIVFRWKPQDVKDVEVASK